MITHQTNFNLDCAIWEITLACNMNCKHCGSSAGSARARELSTQESYTLCEGLAAANCQTVCLMGGEPFLREDWDLIAGCVKDLGMNLAFVSNGILIPKVIDKIARLDANVVGLSLDGMKNVHDSIRKEGSFDAVMRAIELLRQKDIQVTIITTLTKTNFHELLPLRELLSTKGVNWQIQVGSPIGNCDQSVIINDEDYYASAMFISSNQIKNKFSHMPVVGAHCYGFYSHLLPFGRKWTGCTAGISTIGITSDGSIVGCLSMGNNQFFEGNVRDRNFIDIWEDPNSFTYNRKFARQDLGELCRDCVYGKICKGGCNSLSQHMTARLHNFPFCLKRIEEEKFHAKIPLREKLAKKRNTHSKEVIQ
ncbi:MAG: radical SAM domain iron-sulfur cluster-binding oxidoreductase [Promethearchaeota archaeon CR_4]|nr:MAG: radical SAM domain iron-sulfur cluster-binding oxidoreductase [Candidatus Lokiarchaeota archaeon CR_4]